MPAANNAANLLYLLKRDRQEIWFDRTNQSKQPAP
jgi:hypothetical protein